MMTTPQSSDVLSLHAMTATSDSLTDQQDLWAIHDGILTRTGHLPTFGPL